MYNITARPQYDQHYTARDVFAANNFSLFELNSKSAIQFYFLCPLRACPGF
jgi:hypothetical protein